MCWLSKLFDKDLVEALVWAALEICLRMRGLITSVNTKSSSEILIF